MAKRVAEQIIKNGKVTRAWLGVGVQDLTPDLAKAMKLEPYAGALINDTVAGGPAFNAKVVPGDVVSKVLNAYLSLDYTTGPFSARASFKAWYDAANADDEHPWSGRPLLPDHAVTLIPRSMMVLRAMPED